MLPKPPECRLCPLEHLGTSFSNPEGDCTAKVALIGEGLGGDEAIDGLPFRPHAQAGSKLEEVLKLSHLSRSQFLLWNIVGCQPPGNELVGKSYEHGAIEHCKVHFDRVMEKYRPKVLVALGNTAMKTLTGYSGNPKEKQSITWLRGFVFPSKYGNIVPSYHPSYLKRGMPKLTPVLKADIAKALRVAAGLDSWFPHSPSYTKPVYQVSPGQDEAESFGRRVRENRNLILAYDIETPSSRGVEEDEREEIEEQDIVQIQFSLRRGEGIAFPWKEPYISISKRILARDNEKAGHNIWDFDDPRLIRQGVKINGFTYDTMWAFKTWFSSIPRNLQAAASMWGFPFPWKHLFESDLELYGCADVDSVHYLVDRMFPAMKADGTWESYEKHVLSLRQPILLRAQNIGIPVDEGKRLEKKDKFEKKREKLNREVQSLVPELLKNVAPKRKIKDTLDGKDGYSFGYIREPKPIKEARDRYNFVRLKLEKENKPIVPFEVFGKRLTGMVYREFEDPDGTKKWRWARMEEFKGSSEQVLKYIRYKIREEGENV